MNPQHSLGLFLTLPETSKNAMKRTFENKIYRCSLGEVTSFDAMMPDKNCRNLRSNMMTKKSVILPPKHRVCVDGVPILDAVLNTFFCRGYLLKSAFVSIVHITFKYYHYHYTYFDIIVWVTQSKLKAI